MRVYLDNAASAPLDPEVFEAMKPWLLEHYGNPSSSHHHGRILKTEIERSRRKIATAVGASPSEIFFTSGGTESDNLIIRGAAEGLGVDHFITTEIEHHAVSYTVEEMENKGMRVTWLPVDAQGRIREQDLRKALQSGGKALVSIMHVNNELGTINDIVSIGKICREYGAFFHSDTVQALGILSYNLAEMPVDFITGSAHKFYGPKGIGFLYMRSGLKLAPQLRGGTQERNMRAGTENVAGIVGMAFALEKCTRILEEKNRRLQDLKTMLKTGLEHTIPGISFNGDTSLTGSVPTVLNVAFPPDGSEESMLLFNLDIQGISASAGSACTSGSVKGSFVLAGIGCSPERSANSVRFSFGIFNTREEIQYVLEKLGELFKVKV